MLSLTRPNMSYCHMTCRKSALITSAVTTKRAGACCRHTIALAAKIRPYTGPTGRQTLRDTYSEGETDVTVKSVAHDCNTVFHMDVLVYIAKMHVCSPIITGQKLGLLTIIYLYLYQYCITG